MIRSSAKQIPIPLLYPEICATRPSNPRIPEMAGKDARTETKPTTDHAPQPATHRVSDHTSEPITNHAPQPATHRALEPATSYTPSPYPTAHSILQPTMPRKCLNLGPSRHD